MNHRNESIDCPTSTTALVFRQRGQGGGLTGSPLVVVMQFCCSTATLLWSLTAVEAGIRLITRAGAHEHLMTRPSERTGPLQRSGTRPFCPERLLRSAIRLEPANDKQIANRCDHDVAREHAAISPLAHRIDSLPRLVEVPTAPELLPHLSERSCAAGASRRPRRSRTPHRRGTASSQARMRAASSSSRTADIERGRRVECASPCHERRQRADGFLPRSRVYAEPSPAACAEQHTATRTERDGLELLLASSCLATATS